MKVTSLICIGLILLFAGMTFLILEMTFEDNPVEVFNESNFIGFGGIDFQIENSSFLGRNKNG